MTNLSQEALEKAFVELNEPRDQDTRNGAIASLRNAIQTEYPGVKLTRSDDNFLLRFLRAKKFDQAKALTALKNYHSHEQAWPEFFEKVKNPVLVKSTLEKGVCFPLQGKAKNGSSVIVFRPGLEGCNNIIEIYASLYLTVDQLLNEEDVQLFGLSMIVDLAYFSSEIARQFTPTIAVKMTKTMQDSMPILYKGLSFTNEPKIFDAIFAIVQPFIKEKMKKRVFFHGKDFTKLYNVIDKSILPNMFAGSGPDPDIKLWKDKIIQEGTAL